jgi:hypothetical protein
MIAIRLYLRTYQSSLSEAPSEPDQRTRMTKIFKQIIGHYEPPQPKDGRYKHVTLLNLTYEYVLSRDRFLKFFFESEDLGGGRISF